MKLFKNLFGHNHNKISKYEPNTLAEINESPDLRQVADEDTPKKNDKKVAKVTKKVTSANTSKPKNTNAKTSETKTSETAKKAKTTKVDAVKPAEKSPTKSTSSTKSTKSESSTKSEIKPSSADKKGVAKKPVTPVESNNNSSTKKAPAQAKSDNNNAKKSPQKNLGANKNTVKTDENDKDTDLSAKADGDEITETKTTRNGKFEIKKSKDGRYVFNLYASNSVIVATSRVYSSSTSAVNGIKSVIANAASAPIEDQTLKNLSPVSYPKWEVYQDKGQQYRFRLCASNGNCICRSQGYTSKVNCKKGIESIIKFAEDAEITKAYINKNK